MGKEAIGAVVIGITMQGLGPYDQAKYLKNAGIYIRLYYLQNERNISNEGTAPPRKDESMYGYIFAICF